jgi:transcriptional regulator GlxA family with amidase domain
MGQTVAILVFDGVDELDLVGPLDACSYAAGWGADGNELAIVGSEKRTMRAVHDGEVVRGQRYLVDGRVVTSAGVSAGIDAALWVVGEQFGPEHAATVRRNLDYDPAPPY